MNRFDGLVVAPVVMLDGDNEPVDPSTYQPLQMERTDKGDPNTFCWSVYGHLPDGGVLCLCDCPTEQVANDIAHALQDKYGYQHAMNVPK